MRLETQYNVHYYTRNEGHSHFNTNEHAVDNEKEAMKLAIDTMNIRKRNIQAVEVFKIVCNLRDSYIKLDVPPTDDPNWKLIKYESGSRWELRLNLIKFS